MKLIHTRCVSVGEHTCNDCAVDLFVASSSSQSVFLEEDDLSSEAAADLQHQGFLLAAERVNCMTVRSP